MQITPFVVKNRIPREMQCCFFMSREYNGIDPCYNPQVR